MRLCDALPILELRKSANYKSIANSPLQVIVSAAPADALAVVKEAFGTHICPREAISVFAYRLACRKTFCGLTTTFYASIKPTNWPILY